MYRSALERAGRSAAAAVHVMAVQDRPQGPTPQPLWLSRLAVVHRADVARHQSLSQPLGTLRRYARIDDSYSSLAQISQLFPEFDFFSPRLPPKCFFTTSGPLAADRQLNYGRLPLGPARWAADFFSCLARHNRRSDE